MELVSRVGYSSLPLEIRESITQYLDIKSLVALGECDPQILNRMSIFMNQLARTSFKKTFSREYPRQCAAARTVEVDLVARSPPFLCQTDYESVFKYNQDAINNLLDLVSSMCSVNLFLKGELHLQLALFVINCYPPYRRPQG